MSNSIWKTPGFHKAIDNKLKVSKDGKLIYWTMYGWNIPGEDVHDIGVEWAYVEDVLAQADKAERLEKENEAMREEFEVWHGNHKCVLEDNERLQKAVDLAVDALEEMQHWLGVVRCSMISHLNNQNNTLLEHYETDPTVQNIDKAKKILKHYIEQIEHKE